MDVTCGDVVILLPTRELALQIHHILTLLCNELGSINIGMITGGTDLLGDLRNLEKIRPNIIIATPGRLKTILNYQGSDNTHEKSSVFRKNIILKTHTFVLDEADMLLDDHFFTQTRHICNKLINPFVQVIAVSATFIRPQFKQLEDLICSIDDKFITTFINAAATMETIHDILPSMAPGFGYMHNMLSKTILSFDSEIIDWVYKYERKISRIIISASHVNRVDPSLKLHPLFSKNKETLTKRLFSINNDICDESNSPKFPETSSEFGNIATPLLQGIKFYLAKILDAPTIVMQIGLKINCIISILSRISYKKCIIFCNQSHTRIQSSMMLQYFGFQSFVSSSRLSHRERMTMLNDALHTHKVIVICTDVMCRGIGFSDVDLVINMDMAVSKEVFLHRSGRAGRFGAAGTCICICMQSEMETYEYLLYALNFVSEPIQTLLRDNIPGSEFTDSDGIWVFDPLISRRLPCTSFMNDHTAVIKTTIVDSLLDDSRFYGKFEIIGAILPDARINLIMDNLSFYVCFEINCSGNAKISIRYSSVEDGRPVDFVVLEISVKRELNSKLTVYIPNCYSRILEHADLTFSCNTLLHIIISDINATPGASVNGILISLFPTIDLFRILRLFHFNKYLDFKFVDNDSFYSYGKTCKQQECEVIQCSQHTTVHNNLTYQIPQTLLDFGDFMIKYYYNIRNFHFKRPQLIKLYGAYTKNITLKNMESAGAIHQCHSPTLLSHKHFMRWEAINKNAD